MLPEEHLPFRLPSCGSSDVLLRFHCRKKDIEGDKVFDSGGIWSLYLHKDRGWGIKFCSPVRGSLPYLTGIFTEDFSIGDLFVNDAQCLEAALVQPHYPLDELSVVNVLARSRGVLLHASLVDDEGRGWLFTGQSGAGKSTMAGLWERAGATGIYSDDRVIVREHDGQFWAYGTPWHGTGRYASPKRVPLSGIFVLRQAHDNAARDLPLMQAVSQLFARSFPTFWNREGLDFTVGFLQRLCDAVPCYDLGFKPTEEIVAFVRGLNGSV